MSEKIHHKDSDQPYDKVTVSMPHWLLVRIDEEAKKDDRARSNWIARKLAEIVAQMNGNHESS